MWSILRREKGECKKVWDSLEEAAARHREASSVNQWLKELTAHEQEHIDACGACREAAEDLAATKELFRGVVSFAQEERPWFAARVMGAISLREKEIAARLNAWSEFPRFAARFAWVTALLLLAGTTWVFERGISAARQSPSGMAGPESLFEPTPPASQDDVLISMAGNNP